MKRNFYALNIMRFIILIEVKKEIEIVDLQENLGMIIEKFDLSQEEKKTFYGKIE